MRFSAEEVFAEIERQAPSFGIQPKIARAFLLAENTADGKLKPGATFNGAARSGAGARGVFQTLESTDRGNQRVGVLPVSHKYDPKDLPGQVRAGLASLKEMSSRQENPDDVFELATMYNAGSEPWRNYLAGAVDRIPSETRQYWTKIQAALGGSNREKPMGMQAIEQAAAAGIPKPGGAVSATPAGVGTFNSTSTSSSRSGNTFDPTLMAAALNSGLDIIKAGGSLDVASTAISTAVAQRQAAEVSQVTAISDWALKQGEATTASAAIQAGEALRRKQALQMAGLDPDDVSNRYLQAVNIVNQTDMELEPMGREIDQRMAVGFFDNPLEWFVNQTRLPGMVGKYNATAKVQNRAIESAKQLQSLAGTQQSLTAAMDADSITAAARAKAAADASAAQIKLTEAQEAGAGAAIRDAATQAALAESKFNTAIRMAQMTKEHFMEKEGLSEREAQKRAERVQVDEVNKYLKMVGSTLQYTPEQFKVLPAKRKQQLLESTGTGVIAKTFSNAADMIDSVGNINNIAAGGDAAAMNWFKATIAAAQKQTDADLAIASKTANMTGKVLKRDEFLAANLDKLQTQYAGEAGNMRTASESNPLKVNYAAIAKRPELAGNPVAEYINKYGPLSADPLFTTVDEKVLLDRLTTSAMKGQMTVPQAAAAMSEFLTKATEIQAATTKYALFGMSKSEGYRIVVPSSGIISHLMGSAQSGTEEPLDLMKAPAVEAYLSKNLALKIWQQKAPAASDIFLR